MATEEKYLELYKRHSAKRWEDIIGQEKIVRSLKQSVKSNKLSGAYLFSGPRGTGKTSVAKVLSAAINCTDSKSRETGDACGVCETCLNIQENVQLGVRYISMANSGGVDEVRKIVDQARLAYPVRIPIFILDEAHNLSQAAWDSLLIPLESTKMPSLFIFCSTEAHKIPAPIRSRVQSRRFNLVDDETLKAHAESILKLEGIELSEEEVEAAVRLGRGSVRDTLTELESIIATGDFDGSLGESLLLAIQNADILEVLRVVGEYAATGEKIRHLAEDLYEDLRDLLLLRAKGGDKLVAHPPLEDVAEFKSKVPAREHLAVLDAIGSSVTAMSVGAADHRIIFETALLKSVQRLKRAQSSREA